MLTAAELAILAHYGPLYAAEWDRLGLSRADQDWIHAGSDQRPTRVRLEAGLAHLRTLATGMGPRSYCATLGFDYETMKRDVEPDSNMPVDER